MGGIALEVGVAGIRHDRGQMPVVLDREKDLEQGRIVVVVELVEVSEELFERLAQPRAGQPPVALHGR